MPNMVRYCNIRYIVTANILLLLYNFDYMQCCSLLSLCLIQSSDSTDAGQQNPSMIFQCHFTCSIRSANYCQVYWEREHEKSAIGVSLRRVP